MAPLLHFVPASGALMVAVHYLSDAVSMPLIVQLGCYESTVLYGQSGIVPSPRCLIYGPESSFALSKAQEPRSFLGTFSGETRLHWQVNLPQGCVQAGILPLLISVAQHAARYGYGMLLGASPAR